MRRSIETRGFGRIELHRAVVDAQSGQGGENVFDERHLSRRAAEGGSPLRPGDGGDARRDPGRRLQVAARKNDPGANRGRVKTDANRSAGQETDPL